MRPTQRLYTDINTSINYRLYTDDKQNYRLINLSKPEPTNFYLCAHTGATIKTSSGKEVQLDMGTFYSLKSGEKVTHIKYTGFKRFTKL